MDDIKTLDREKLLIEDFRNALDLNVEIKSKTSTEWRGLCPFHDDTKLSFSANIEKGVWKCFVCGGGNHYQFLKELGHDVTKYHNGHFISKKDTIIQPKRKEILQNVIVSNKPLKEPKNTILKNSDIILKLPRILQYKWTQEALDILEVGCKPVDPKKEKYGLVFPIHNEKAEWVNLWFHKPICKFLQSGFKCQLYPLHLIKDYDKDIPILVAEGMKDVVTLVSYGYQAISGTNGSSIPKDLTPLSKFRDFLVLNDNDDVGVKTQEEWCMRLSLLKKNVSYTEWGHLSKSYPIKSDITDIPHDVFIELWNTSVNYNNMNKKGIRTMSAFQFVEKSNESVEYIVENLLTEKGVLVIGASDGVGKSLMASQLGICISSGQQFLGAEGIIEGFKVIQKPVLLINFELSDKELAMRITHQMQSEELKEVHTDDYEAFLVSRRDELSIFKDKWDYLENTISKNTKIHGGVLILDNLYSSTNKNVSENHELQSVLSRIEDIKQKYDMSIIIITHFNKTQKGDILETRHITGGKMLTNYADNVFLLGSSQYINDLRIGKITKIRSGKSEIKNIPFKLRLQEQDLIFYRGEPIKNEEAHFNGNASMQEVDVLMSMKGKVSKWLNTNNEMFTINQYEDAMENILEYKPKSEATKFNWVNKLIKLGIVKKLGKNQYKPLWDVIEDE